MPPAKVIYGQQASGGASLSLVLTLSPPCRGQLLLVFEGEVLQTEITKQWGKWWSWGTSMELRTSRKGKADPGRGSEDGAGEQRHHLLRSSLRARGLCIHILHRLVHGFRSLSVPICPMETLLACTSQG